MKHKIIIILIFGLGFILRIYHVNHSTSLLSIILGSLVPLLFYLIVKQVNQKNYLLPLITAFIAATNPWNINFSRVTSEINIIVFIILLSILLYLKKIYLPAILLTIITLLYLLNNNVYIFTSDSIKHYLNYFSPKYLLTEGDYVKHLYSPPYTGVLLLPSVFFLILGIFLGKNISKKLYNIFLILILLLPIPAALTLNIIDSELALPLSIPFIYFISLGIYKTIHFSKKHNRLFPLYLIFLIISYLTALYLYLDLYYAHYLK